MIMIETTEEKTKEELQDIFQLIEDISNIDVPECEGFNSITPYVVGRAPKPTKWKDVSLQHKLA